VIKADYLGRPGEFSCMSGSKQGCVGQFIGQDGWDITYTDRVIHSMSALVVSRTLVWSRSAVILPSVQATRECTLAGLQMRLAGLWI